MCQPFSFESLEDRRLMSVTATTLAGPLLTGTTWTYKSTSTGASSALTIVDKVVGTAKVGKVTCVEVDGTFKNGTTTNTNKDFVHLDTKTGFVAYKDTSVTKTTTYTSNVVELFSPYNTTYPAALTAGKTYKFTWTQKVTSGTTITPTRTTDETVVYTVKLLSDKTVKVTVPAGTFSCYQIQATTKTTYAGSTTTTTSTLYSAPNVGQVKLVAGGTTTVLTKFVKGK